MRVLTMIIRCLPFLLALGTSSALQAQTCANFSHVINFADGQKGCVTDYPFSKMVPDGDNRDIASKTARLNNNNLYAAIALPRDGQVCPAVAGFIYFAYPLPSNSSDPALRSCNAAVAKQGRAGDSRCACIVAYVNGASPLTKVAFEAAALPGSPLSGSATATAAPAQAPLPGPTPIAVPAVTPTPTPAAAPVAIAAAPAVAVTAVAAVSSPPRMSARALVIGNSAYSSFGRLPNPRNDARAIAEKFRSFGIDVDLVLDADRASLVRALNNFQTNALGRDVNILYYAGHGVQVNGINYLVPTDMQADGISIGYVKLNGVALNDALDYLPAKTRLVFLDACRDNPAARSLTTGRGGPALGLAPVNTASGTLIAYATKEGATAEDGTGFNSPYTRALLQHLDAEQDIGIVLRRVRQSVMTQTSNRQEPWEYGSLVGDQLVLSRMARQP